MQRLVGCRRETAKAEPSRKARKPGPGAESFRACFRRVQISVVDDAGRTEIDIARLEDEMVHGSGRRQLGLDRHQASGARPLALMRCVALTVTDVRA